MAKMIVLYGAPKDPAAFDRYYRETHLPLVKAIPGLCCLEVNHGPVSTPFDSAVRHCVTVLTFDSLDATSATSPTVAPTYSISTAGKSDRAGLLGDRAG